MPKLAAFASLSPPYKLPSPPPLPAIRPTGEVQATRAPRYGDQAPAATPLTEAEALLAQRLKRHLAEHPRCCQAAPSMAGARKPAASEAGAAGPEEVRAIDEVGPGLPFMMPMPPPLPEAGPLETEADGEGGEGEAVGPPPAWLVSRRRPSLRARLKSTVAWTTTLTIVTAVVGTAVLGLVGMQRSLAVAEGAVARIVDVGRAIGLIHV